MKEREREGDSDSGSVRVSVCVCVCVCVVCVVLKLSHCFLSEEPVDLWTEPTQRESSRNRKLLQLSDDLSS